LTLRKLTHRVRQALRIFRREGTTGLTRRVVRAAAMKVGGDVPEIPLLPGDVADSASLPAWPAAPRRSGGPLTIGWVTTPPSRGSGGHTTTLRFVEALEQAGHSCVLYLYDRFEGDLDGHTDIVRSWWPQIRSEVRDLRDGLPTLDAYVATSWPTAHALATRGTGPGERFYLAQDFEPYFYARGSEYVLAEDTYRFGFHTIAVGHMVANELRERFGIESDIAEFGCDVDVYSLTNTGPRRDVVFYVKPDTPRRGYWLAVMALELLHQRHPEVGIHTFGVRVPDLPFPAQTYRPMPPRELNELYNRCIAGFALSFTNISLIANEQLAAGITPVVNDSPLTRADLDNPFVQWARPTPRGLADALCEVVERGADADRLERIAASVRGLSWDPAKRTVIDAIERRCYGTGIASAPGASDAALPLGGGVQDR
jgi:O-antigen biosynthesis protein